MSETFEKRHDDIDEIRRDIEDTRRRISTEIEALETKLTPSHAKEVIKERIVETKDRITDKVQASASMVRDDVSRVGTEIVSTARANPLPVALIGVGTGWLVWEALRSRRAAAIEPAFELANDTPPGFQSLGEIRSDDVSVSAGSAVSASHGLDVVKERANETFRAAKERAASSAKGVASRARTVVESTRERASHLAGTTRERASHLAEGTRERASELATRGRAGMGRAESWVEEAYQVNPLAFGALAALAGIGIAMALPRTAREAALLGEAREQLLDRARQLADGAKQVALDAAREGASAAKDAAKREIEEGRLAIPRTL